MAQSTPALFVVTSLLDDWAGEGAAVVQWAAWQRDARPLPWSLPAIVPDVAGMEASRRDAVARAVDRLFTADEAKALGEILRRETPFGFAPLRYGQLELPLTADEALTMQAPVSGGVSQTLWRVRLPDDILPEWSPAIEGIISLWPWPGLTPDEIAPLIALRERLGLDPLPAVNPGGDNGGPGAPG